MRLLRFACWLLIFGTSASHAEAEVKVEAIRKGEFIEARASAAIDAPLSVIWTTLTDYDRLPEFIPGLRRSKSPSRRDGPGSVEPAGGVGVLGRCRGPWASPRASRVVWTASAIRPLPPPWG